MQHSPAPMLLQDAPHDQLPPSADQSRSQWHEIACEDVAVTNTALDAIKQAARQLLPRHVPQESLPQLTVGDGLALMARDIFWEEGSGQLCLCTEIGQRRYCLHIPPEHWEFRVTGPVH